MPKPKTQIPSCEQKLKSVESEYREFVDALSHDLAGPFRHIIGFSEMIMRANESTFDEKTRQKFNFILAGGHDGKAMLDHLKAYARLTDDAKPEMLVDVSQMVVDVLEELADLTDKNATEIDIGTLPDLTASPDILKITFFQILKNAIMYSNKAEQPNVKITGTATLSHVLYEVIDNGIGMTDYQTDKVLKVLKRAVSPDDYPGNGMGLAIAKKAVQYHNGTIDIESSPETGSKVTISFPLISV